MAFYKQRNERSEQSDNTLLFGLRPIIEAIQSGKEIDKLFIQNGLSGELAVELKKLVQQRNINFQYVPIEKLNRLTSKNHQGAVCFLASIVYQDIEAILPTIFEKGKIPLILMLDRITDVRNFGAIARTAECTGTDAIIIPTRGGAQVNGDAIKTSAGALHKIPVCRSENLKTTIDYLKESGLQVVACTEKTDTLYYNIDFKAPTLIIMGSEEDGISGEYLKRADAKGKIPLQGEIGSLNVSVACGVMLYEAVRQRLIT